MRIFHLFYTICVSLLLIVACDEKGPDSLLPDVSVNPATEITRNSAHISGMITLKGEHTAVNRMLFRYGTDKSMKQSADCTTQDNPHAMLQNLQPGSTYFYCLAAGNEYSQVQSDILSFTTMPKTVPCLGELTLVNKGPISITLQCAVQDNGGDAVTRAGFRCISDKGVETELEIIQPNDTIIYGKLSGLIAEQNYSIYAYACNSIGEIQSNKLTFRTSQSVILSVPGTLNEIIGQDEKYKFSKIAIAGPLNGTDIRLLRDMLGVGIDGQATPGQLCELNLTDATIVQGGISYDGIRFTRNKVIGKGMFAACMHLNRLCLPNNSVIIEKDAFHSCPALSTLQIPAEVSQIEPSLNCPKLSCIELAGNSPYLYASNGILYNKEKTTLLWFPEGKTELDLLTNIERIGKYAFRNCQLESITLPKTITSIANEAFYGAKIRQLILPDNLRMIQTGLLQACTHLTSVVLGKHTEFIANYAFDECPLQHLYVQTETFPPHCMEKTFSTELYHNCVLHVPQSSIEIYKNAEYWKEFQKMQTLPNAFGAN